MGSESFTSGPPQEKWNAHPFSLKAMGDYVYCCGINRFLIHVAALQPFVDDHLRPGFTCGCNGIHFDRCNTWWKHGARQWATYLARCQSLLQAGENVADVLYFQGNDSPDGVGPYLPALPAGYDYDACDSETLARLAVRDRRVVTPSGASYRYFVLPQHGRVTLASLRHIAALADEGVPIVGTLPKGSPSLADAAGRDEYERLTKELAARVRPQPSFEDILTADKLPPDFDFDKASGLVLHYTHRRIGDADVYFVASAGRDACEVGCQFRVADKVPELWHPDTGVMEPSRCTSSSMARRESRCNSIPPDRSSSCSDRVRQSRTRSTL